jgi:lipoprotein-anchoring transpeptidase ErfK/SrfK
MRLRRGKARLALATIIVATATMATTAVIVANAGNSTGAETLSTAAAAAVAPAAPSPSPEAPDESANPTATPPSTPTPSPTPTYDTATKPCPPTASACVDIAAAKAWLQTDGRVTRGPVQISTGMAGHPTPTGSFHVAWKAEYTRSTIYDIPMPYSVFFATGGIAFHEGPLDEPSHGCVHLDHADAQAFFGALKVGDQVVVW